MYRELRKHNILVAYVLALSLLASKSVGVREVTETPTRFWPNLSYAAEAVVSRAIADPRPHRSVATLLGAGTISVAQFCLPWKDPPLDPSVEILCKILPYVYTSRAYHSAMSNIGMPESLKTHEDPPDQRFQIWSGLTEAFVHEDAAFVKRQNLHVKMCNSLIVRDADE
jgi:hypothetical protein